MKSVACVSSTARKKEIKQYSIYGVITIQNKTVFSMNEFIINTANKRKENTLKHPLPKLS